MSKWDTLFEIEFRTETSMFIVNTGILRKQLFIRNQNWLNVKPNVGKRFWPTLATNPELLNIRLRRIDKIIVLDRKTINLELMYPASVHHQI